MLNHQWLNTFKTLVEVGHFTQTAEQLHMTQPGVSQHIKKLEQSCNAALLTREGKAFELTEQGKLVYQHALAISQQEQALIEKLSYDHPYRGDCLLACSGSLAVKLYPRCLELQQDHPEFIVHLEAAPNYKILADIESNAIDTGIVTERPNRGFEFDTIGQETLCLILPSQYQNSKITKELLNKCGLVNHPDAKMYLDLYLKQCGNDELMPLNIDTIPIVSYINQLTQIPLSVEMGVGFTVLPLSALQSLTNRQNIAIHKPNNAVTEQLYWVQKKGRALASRYHTLKSQVESWLK